MTVEILFNEVCNLFGDGQNAAYLQATLPEADFIYTPLTKTPYFVDRTPDMIYIGAMSEATQRRVIAKLRPHAERLEALIEAGIPILATGNAGEIFCKRIEYITEDLCVDGLNFFDLTVKTDLFDRYNGKVLGEFKDMKLVGFRSQFSFVYGDNENNYFMKCLRGKGINRNSNLEGYCKNNLICTSVIGPILPLNPLFCEYFVRLAGMEVTAAFRDTATEAYKQHLKEFSDSSVAF